MATARQALFVQHRSADRITTVFSVYHQSDSCQSLENGARLAQKVYTALFVAAILCSRRRTHCLQCLQVKIKFNY